MLLRWNYPVLTLATLTLEVVATGNVEVGKNRLRVGCAVASWLSKIDAVATIPFRYKQAF